MSANLAVTALALAGLLPAAEPQRSGGAAKPLAAAMSASKWIVRPGERTTLKLDLDVKPEMHIYGLGAKGYVPLEWKMRDSTIGKFEPPVYPKTEILPLPPFSEKLPVYTNLVRLTRDFMTSLDLRNAATGQFTLEGTLNYQACDEKMCYFPQEMPLKWTLRLEVPDEKR